MLLLSRTKSPKWAKGGREESCITVPDMYLTTALPES